jgi:hypothetical protein
VTTTSPKHTKELAEVTTGYDKATRRQIIRAGLVVVGGVLAVSARAQDKIAQAQVQYQPTPKDGNKCSACVSFDAPAACKIVAGKIDPNGWCIAYAPKEENKG